MLAHSYCGPHFVRLSVTTGFHEARAGSKNAMGQESSVAPGRGYGAVLSELPSEGLLRDDLTWGEGVPALSLSTCQRVKVSICQGPMCLCHVSSGRGPSRAESL